VALAARRAGVVVYLSDRDAAAARIAEALGAGLARTPRHPVDLALLAVPPTQVGPALRDAQTRRFAHSYTDVAGVKGEPERDVLRLAPDPAAYVGGHPMAGRERSGPLAAAADLFAGKAWVLTPTERTEAAALDRATELAALCGAVPVRLDSRTHDTTVALTSHVPHLMASLTAARLREGPAETETLAGQGVRDVTRIAAGDPVLWADVVVSNAPAVAAVLRGVHADLARLLSAVETLAGRDPAGRAVSDPADVGRAELVVTDVLERGAAGAARVRPAAGPRGEQDRLRVTVGRRPGDLARLLRDTATHGATVTGAALAGGGQLVVHLEVPAGASAAAMSALGGTGGEAGRSEHAPTGL
jgi:prephenate dehydrogenase